MAIGCDFVMPKTLFLLPEHSMISASLRLVPTKVINAGCPKCGLILGDGK